MPIEIRELVIKAEIGNNRKNDAANKKISKHERQQLVQDCVDQVMEMLKKERER